MDGETFLRRYLDTHSADLARSPDDAALVLDRAQAAAEALVSVGALHEDVAGGILEELRGRSPSRGGSGLLVAPSGPVGTTEESGPYSWGDVSHPAPAPQLRRVIPVVRDGLLGDARLTLISVEIWSEHLTVRAVVTAGADRIGPPPLWAWRIRDDEGGVYERGGGHTGGGRGAFFVEQDFRPAPAPTARALIVSARRLEPIEGVDPQRMIPVTGFPGEELLRFEVPLDDRR